MQQILGGSVLLIVLWPIAFAWLHPDIMPGLGVSAGVKLGVLLVAFVVLTLLINYRRERRWSLPLRKLEANVASLPSVNNEFVDEGPAEIQRLSRALRNMTTHIQQIVERANIELARREAILTCMAEGVLAVDAELKVVFCNDAFAEAFGANASNAEGRILYEIVREPLLREILERVLRTGSAEKDRFQLPTAGSRWFEARALPLGSEPRRGAVIVLHDVTDLEHQERIRKDFVADVSHELRTPLSTIRGYAETLLDGALEDRQNNRRFVEVILSHAIRLGNIASDLLVLSELDNETGCPIEPQRVSLREVLDSAMHSVQEAAMARSVRINSENCGDCHVLGLRFRLEQVFVNLLDNAVKFNRDQGEVMIECRYSDEKRVCISIADTGIGIPSGDLKRIFERFYRVDKARSRPAGGTGLGLPIVKEIVERMGGTVSVESVLGRGSKFMVTLNAA